MKSNIILIMLIGLGLGTKAQQTGVQVPLALKNRIMEGIQLGSLMCYNEKNQLCLCQGKQNENIAGLATSTPYITINKPAEKAINKDEFISLVSTSNGKINKGDFLISGLNGQLIKGDQIGAVAIALEDFKGPTMLVKWIKK